jgi:hypothetical protein
MGIIDMETTINIHTDILEKIQAAARTGGVSCSGLIILLFKKVMEDMPGPGKQGRRIRYQRRGKQEDWFMFHLQLREDEYEYLLDLRKLLKMSVSLILAYAVKKYLAALSKKDYTDNYQFRNYVVSREIFHNVICWRFIWGFPPDIEQLIKFT